MDGTACWRTRTCTDCSWAPVVWVHSRVCVSRCAHTQIACERLLNFRVELKVAGKRIGDVLNRIHIAMPKARWVQGAGLATPPATSCIAWTHMRR